MPTLKWSLVLRRMFRIYVVHYVAFVVWSSKVTVRTLMHYNPSLLILPVVISTRHDWHNEM